MEQDGAVPLPAELAGTQLPRHLAVIMDGNFRWATQRALDRNAGHEAGLEAFKSLLRCCRSWGVEALTVSGFSGTAVAPFTALCVIARLSPP